MDRSCLRNILTSFTLLKKGKKKSSSSVSCWKQLEAKKTGHQCNKCFSTKHTYNWLTGSPASFPSSFYLRRTRERFHATIGRNVTLLALSSLFLLFSSLPCVSQWVNKWLAHNSTISFATHFFLPIELQTWFISGFRVLRRMRQRGRIEEKVDRRGEREILFRERERDSRGRLFTSLRFFDSKKHLFFSSLILYFWYQFTKSILDLHTICIISQTVTYFLPSSSLNAERSSFEEWVSWVLITILTSTVLFSK